MGGNWLYSCYFVECCFQVLFKKKQHFCVVSIWLFLKAFHLSPGFVTTQKYWHDYNLEEILFFCIRDQISMTDNLPIAFHCMLNAYVDILFSRWDIASEVCELVKRWFIVWVLWNINFCRSFNAQSILYKQSVQYQTIQFSMEYSTAPVDFGKWTGLKYIYIYIYSLVSLFYCINGVMVIIVGNGHSNTSSNPGRDWLHFT